MVAGSGGWICRQSFPSKLQLLQFEEMGAKVISQYSLLGEYDFVNILEASSNEVISRVSAQLGSRGTLIPMTMAAITMQDYVRELDTAKIISK